jgi:hypothetical protein
MGALFIAGHVVEDIERHDRVERRIRQRDPREVVMHERPTGEAFARDRELGGR